MNTKKATKRALLTSVMALVMCVVMLVGTTFAWFTDTASTAVNKIQSGKLDIELEYKNNTTGGEFKPANKETEVFNNGALWEPGHVEYVVLKVSNAGNLALKYKLGINIASETGSNNVYGNEFKLSDYIKFAVLEGESENLNDRAALVAEAGTGTELSKGYTSEEGHLTAGDSKTVTLVVWMPTTVGNEANHKTGEKTPTIDLGITVAATQYTYESDSFDETYDEDATYPVVVSQSQLNDTLTLEDLKGENGKIAPVEVTLGDVAATDISYSENNSGYTGKGVMLGSTNLNSYAAKPADEGQYKFTFKDGTIDGTVTGYSSIDGATTNSVYMLVPGNSDVVFENMTFNGVVSFDIQKYTSPWSNLNSITFKNCTFNGIIVGTCPASNVTFDGCTFNAYTNEVYANNSNPIWWREDTEGSGDNANPIKTFTFVNNKVTGTRPIKIERIGYTVSPIFTIKNNTFDISKQAGDDTTKNMAINIGMGENPKLPFTLIDEGNTISSNTAALYTASITNGSNQYKEISGMKVLDGNGNEKVITAMVWKTTTGETFELKSVK